VLPEELEAKQHLIVQYSTGRFGISENLLKEAAGVEIRFGQGAYPGKGSFLPAAKMTEDVAKIRGLMRGEDAYSPAHHPDILGFEDLRKKIDWLRSMTGGVPIGAKIGCGAIERDISVLVRAGIDFIAIDGFGGGTGATNDYVRENVGIPLIAALPRAARQLRKLDAQDRVSLIAGGNLRTSADFAKCLALGADGVYIGTAALIAINCEQYRICHTGLCPTGVTTQNPDLTAQCNVDEGVRRLGNYIRVMTEEIANLARITGKNNIHDLDALDLVSLNRDLSTIAGCPWIGDPDVAE
jgi:glutamate synthase domain-containing protein 2